MPWFAVLLIALSGCGTQEGADGAVALDDAGSPCDLALPPDSSSHPVEGDAALPLPPPIVLLHLSDTHFGVHPTAPSAIVTRFLEDIVPVIQPHVVIHSGDLTEDGSVGASWASYRAAVETRVPPWPAYVDVPGNHDLKHSGTANYLAHAQTARALGTLHGVALLSTSSGTLRMVLANTADTPLDATSLLGFVGTEQEEDLLSDPALNVDHALSLIVGHHPMSGPEGLQILGSDVRMQHVIDQYGALFYFCGHLHSTSLSWIGPTLVVQAPAFGRTDLTANFMLAAFDGAGPIARPVWFDASQSAATWPVVLITRPAHVALAGANPHAQPLANGGEGVRLRVLIFAPEPPAAAEWHVDEDDWQPLEPAGGALWEATLPARPLGSHRLEARATVGERTNINTSYYATE